MDRAGFRAGIRMFNQAEFFEAHEALEDVWRAAPAPEKKFLQGVIQIAVALHHHSTGNLVGACSLLRRATKNLTDYPTDYAGIRLDLLLASVAHWQQALENGEPLPSLPRVVMAEVE